MVKPMFQNKGFTLIEMLLVISIIQNSHENQSLENYIQLTFMQLNQFVSKFIKIIVPLIYGFVATFVIVVYVSIIIPMMNVVSNL